MCSVVARGHPCICGRAIRWNPGRVEKTKTKPCFGVRSYAEKMLWRTTHGFAATPSPRAQQAAWVERGDIGGADFSRVQGGRSRYLPAGTQTLFADAISAFATFVEMLTLCSPSLFRGMA